MNIQSVTIPLMLLNPQGLVRHDEPVIGKIVFPENAAPETLRITDDHGRPVAHQLFDMEIVYGRITAQIVLLADLDAPCARYNAHFGGELPAAPDGIHLLPVTLPDGVRRLDTGRFILELCRGKADGTAAGKWGVRYFEDKEEGRNLIRGCGNAIGGFYGPFFTPANGLVNPPEHSIADFTAEVEGPLYCRYLLSGVVPDGLDHALRGKTFRIRWEFFYRASHFRRVYDIDGFSTLVDGMPVESRITVGDEFESGAGNRVFNRFASYGGTLYRAGDLYANLLADEVRRLLAQPPEEAREALDAYRESVGDNINAASWDYFWRMFSVRDHLLSSDEIRRQVARIIPLAHRAVHQSPRFREILQGDWIDVDSAPEQTIFPLCTSKTAEYNDQTGYVMIWCTSKPVGRYQIVQRNDSGWVNWGTNGENEYPELPVGSAICTAYGKFSNWQERADAMEQPVLLYQGLSE